MKRFLIITLLLATVIEGKPRPVLFGVSGGIGLPKIPISQYRSPISVLGGGMGHLSIYKKLGVQIDANALTTFSLGSVNNAPGDLRFDVLWGDLALTYRLRGMLHSQSNLIVGTGHYTVIQEFNQGREEIQTQGVNLGISNWMAGRRLRSYFEVRWHLMFTSGEDPQVLTLTYGILF